MSPANRARGRRCYSGDDGSNVFLPGSSEVHRLSNFCSAGSFDFQNCVAITVDFQQSHFVLTQTNGFACLKIEMMVLHVAPLVEMPLVENQPGQRTKKEWLSVLPSCLKLLKTPRLSATNHSC